MLYSGKVEKEYFTVGPASVSLITTPTSVSLATKKVELRFPLSPAVKFKDVSDALHEIVSALVLEKYTCSLVVSLRARATKIFEGDVAM